MSQRKLKISKYIMSSPLFQASALTRNVKRPHPKGQYSVPAECTAAQIVVEQKLYPLKDVGLFGLTGHQIWGAEVIDLKSKISLISHLPGD